MAEFTLGTLSSTPTVSSNFVGSSDTSDLYSFTLSSAGNINLALTGLSADADVRLYRDVNNNGLIDSSDTYISGSARGSNYDDSINVESQAAGQYLVQVSQFSGDTKYDLRLSTTSGYSDPSNLLPTETEVGTLSGTRTFYDSVSKTDTADVFHVALNGSSLSVSLTGLSSDADVRVIHDINSNLVVDAGEVIGISAAGSNSPESISLNNLVAGDNYFVEVYQYATNITNNSYTLTLTA
jgi:hypothetical protein